MGGRFISKTTYFSCHMRLVAIAGARGQLYQASFALAGDPEQTLETKYRVKCFRAVTHRRREPSLQLPRAYPEDLAQLLHFALRVSRQPADAVGHRWIIRGELLAIGQQSFAKGCRLLCTVCFSNALEPIFPGRATESTQRGGLVEKPHGRSTKKT